MRAFNLTPSNYQTPFFFPLNRKTMKHSGDVLPLHMSLWASPHWVCWLAAQCHPHCSWHIGERDYLVEVVIGTHWSFVIPPGLCLAVQGSRRKQRDPHFPQCLTVSRLQMYVMLRTTLSSSLSPLGFMNLTFYSSVLCLFSGGYLRK